MNSRKNKKGGVFFSKRRVTPILPECNVNNLAALSKDVGDGQDPLIKMKNNYQKCCPKDFMGKKNSSPYCKQLDMNFNSLSNYQRNIEGYYGDETDVSKINRIMNEPSPQYVPPITVSPKKPWYQFWGGKKTRKNRRK